MNARYARLIISLILILLTIAVYWPVGAHQFVNYDDDEYITENYQVRKGLNWQGVRWAFTVGYAANWHPLTWLSHMLDVELYGLKPSGHHWTSVILHILNSLLLFLLMQRMTGALWKSGIVAALFAIHPLHVESVAWVSERKDVLSTLFGLLALWFYLRHWESRNGKNKAKQKFGADYWLVIIFFFMGLMAKPMLVTLPFLMLLLDFWPLGRIGFGRSDASVLRQIKPLVLEKIPLFILVLISCGLTLVAQQRGKAVMPLVWFTFETRLANAVISYVTYLWKTFWPVDLAFFYPHPGKDLALWKVVISVFILISVIAVSVTQIVKRKFLATGWFWYLGTLIPVIGLVQVGIQGMADRYTYIPLIGIFILCVWWVASLSILEKKWAQYLAGGMVAFGIAAYAHAAHAQVMVWRDNITLFSHALEVTEKNNIAHGNLGLTLARAGRIDDAIEHYEKALEIFYHDKRVHNNLGMALAEKGRIQEAIQHYRTALELDGEFAQAHMNLAVDLIGTGHTAEAEEHFRRALEINPHLVGAHYNFGRFMEQQGRLEESEKHYRRALEIDPGYEAAARGLNRVLQSRGGVR